MGRSAADGTATYDACQIHRAQVGGVIGQGRQRLVPCPPRAHADDPPSTPDEMPAVVREAKGFDVAEARTVRADTTTGDTVFDVVEGVACFTRHCRLGFAVYHSAGGFEATPHSPAIAQSRRVTPYRRTRPRRSPRANPLHLPRTRCDKACRRRRPSSPPRMHRRA